MQACLMRKWRIGANLRKLPTIRRATRALIVAKHPSGPTTSPTHATLHTADPGPDSCHHGDVPVAAVGARIETVPCHGHHECSAEPDDKCRNKSRRGADCQIMAACIIQHRARSQGSLRSVAQRHALSDLSEQRATEPHFATPAHRRGLIDGSRGSTRSRAFPRAHGFQWHQTSHRRRTRATHAASRHRLRCSRKCLHLLRRDRVHARSARHVGANDEARLHRHARLRRWRVARPGRNRQGTRRDPRGKSEPRFGRLPHHATAVFQSAARFARHAAFSDRRRRSHQQGHAREIHRPLHALLHTQPHDLCSRRRCETCGNPQPHRIGIRIDAKPEKLRRRT